MKRGFWLFCLLVCLLAAGCGEGTPDVSDGAGMSSVSSAPNAVSEPSALSLPTVSDDQSSSCGETSASPDVILNVSPGLCFRLPDGWKTDAASSPETLFFASSADGISSVGAAYTALETVQGLTEALLIEEFRATLRSAWEGAGATGVNAASVSVSLLEEPHEALSLTASVDGRSVCQLQLYLLRSDGLYTLTVTAGNLEGAKALLAAFENA